MQRNAKADAPTPIYAINARECRYLPTPHPSTMYAQLLFSNTLAFCAMSCLTTVLVLFFPAALIILGVIPLTATLPVPYLTSSNKPSYCPCVTESFLLEDLTGLMVLASLGSDTTDGRWWRRRDLLSEEWLDSLSESLDDVLWDR
jgi:hypothetical protein